MPLSTANFLASKHIMHILICFVAMAQCASAVLMTFEPQEVVSYLENYVHGAVQPRSDPSVGDLEDLCNQLKLVTSSPSVQCCKRDNGALPQGDQILNLCTPLDTSSKLLR
jgi:hypothetical protein